MMKHGKSRNFHGKIPDILFVKAMKLLDMFFWNGLTDSVRVWQPCSRPNSKLMKGLMSKTVRKYQENDVLFFSS